MRATRPVFAAGYGVPAGGEGMLDWSWADERLTAARNYWLVTVRRDRRPHAMPVWGVWTDGALYFSSSRAAVKGRNIARDPRVSVHLESGDEVVILEGVVEDWRLDDDLAAAYSRKYAFDVEAGEGWYRFEPETVLAWTERTYPRSVTKFVR